VLPSAGKSSGISVFSILKVSIYACHPNWGRLVWIRPKEQTLVGETLAKARLQSGLTQQQLARKLGKPQSFVSAYEAGQRRVDVLEFVRIARAIGANATKLFASIDARR
jgi:DNA-binding XRE family transcriptional regulator